MNTPLPEKKKAGLLLEINDMVIKLYHCPKCDYEAGQRLSVINHIINKHLKELERKAEEV